MPRGESGRIVIEIDPVAKRQLYAALSLTGTTLKDWFLQQAKSYCDECAQPSFPRFKIELPSAQRKTT